MNNSSGTILFVVAPSFDANEAGQLIKKVESELERKGVRFNFSIEQSNATTPDALQRELLSRFGQGSGVLHLCVQTSGPEVMFATTGPHPHANAVATALRLCQDEISAVALSSSYSDEAAAALSQIATVVGTTSAAGVGVTESFFVGFYRGLAHRNDAESSYDFGVNQVELSKLDPIHCRKLPTANKTTPPPTANVQPGAHQTRTIHNLRPLKSTFTGRGALLQQISDNLHASPAVLTQALEGMGGVGKTELAVEFGYRNMDHFDIVWWIGCEEPDGIGGYLDELAVRLDIPGANAGDRLPALDHWLATNERWLIIADNVTNWANTAPRLPLYPTGAMIVTTRETGVHPDGIPVDVFTPAEAQAFIRRRLRQEDANGTRLAEALGFLPLALEQACSYILTTGRSIDEYVTLYKTESAKLLDHGTTGGHDGTVAATFGLALHEAKRLAETDPFAVDPEQLATVFAFLAADNIPLWLLDHLQPTPS